MQILGSSPGQNPQDHVCHVRGGDRLCAAFGPSDQCLFHPGRPDPRRLHRCGSTRCRREAHSSRDHRFSAGLERAAVQLFRAPEGGSAKVYERRTVLPNALRLVTAVALQVTAIWTDRRYLDMSLLRRRRSSKTRPREAIEEFHRASDLHTTRDLTPHGGCPTCKDAEARVFLARLQKAAGVQAGRKLAPPRQGRCSLPRGCMPSQGPGGSARHRTCQRPRGGPTGLRVTSPDRSLPGDPPR